MGRPEMKPRLTMHSVLAQLECGLQLPDIIGRWGDAIGGQPVFVAMLLSKKRLQIRRAVLQPLARGDLPKWAVLNLRVFVFW